MSDATSQQFIAAIERDIQGRMDETLALGPGLATFADDRMRTRAESWMPAWRVGKSGVRATVVVDHGSRRGTVTMTLQHRPFFGKVVKGGSMFNPSYAVIGPAAEAVMEKLSAELSGIWGAGSP